MNAHPAYPSPRAEFRDAYRWTRVVLQNNDNAPTPISSGDNAMLAAMGSRIGGKRIGAPTAGGGIFVFPQGIQQAIASGMVPDARLQYVRRLRELRGVA